MAAFIDTVSRLLRQSPLNRIIAVNILAMVALRLGVMVAYFIVGDHARDMVTHVVSVPSGVAELAMRPWTLLTYMFAQYGLLHLLFNMLWLWWFARIFLEITPSRHLLPLYVYGGLAGAVLFIAVFNVMPAFGGGTCMWLMGSSASVLAIVVATAILLPDYPVGLLFLGSVRLKWVAVVTVAIVLLNNPDGDAGGMAAHIGGILMGVNYALLRRRGVDITRPWVACADYCRSARRRISRPRPARHAPPPKRPESPASGDERLRADLDAILDKIKQSGYAGLTDEEKKKLFDVSSRVK